MKNIKFDTALDTACTRLKQGQSPRVIRAILECEDGVTPTLVNQVFAKILKMPEMDNFSTELAPKKKYTGPPKKFMSSRQLEESKKVHTFDPNCGAPATCVDYNY